MTDALLRISSGTAEKVVQLADYLEPAATDRARDDANAWIKGLRLLEIDGVPMRRRFTYRGDSLWWFTELYLHKQQTVFAIYRSIAALTALMQTESPVRLGLERADSLTQFLVPQIAGAQRIHVTGAPARHDWTLRLAKLKARARWLHLGAQASRLRGRAPAAATATGQIAAFVHRAFWRESPGTGGDEAYIGPVLQALAHQGPGLAFVSLGPPENFAARRWWHPLRAERSPASAPPIESFAPAESLAGSRQVWTDRRPHLRALGNSAALRAAATIGGYDCWPLVREALAGVALLQWPWSARAMDEAAAALDRLRPSAAVTYAEAGGWGRALVLECRRRSIPSIGLQHGFIYRHWLNYLHEPDEMLPDPGRPSDPGFPLPTCTLLFDGYAREHLMAAGHYPAESLVVTGSARLDALVADARDCTEERLRAARAEAGADARQLVLLVTKYKEAADALRELAAAVERMPDVQLAIKTHPAETPAVYGPLASGRARVTVLPSSAPLAPLIMASRAVVTVNSTVALDAAVLGTPALVIGLPNNLSPIVDAGAMAGAGAGSVAPALERILYDQELRLQLDANRRMFLSRYDIRSDGTAADRAAAAILDTTRVRRGAQ